MTNHVQYFIFSQLTKGLHMEYLTKMKILLLYGGNLQFFGEYL